jgi:predicted metalloprotease
VRCQGVWEFEAIVMGATRVDLTNLTYILIHVKPQTTQMPTIKLFVTDHTDVVTAFMYTTREYYTWIQIYQSHGEKYTVPELKTNKPNHQTTIF